MVEKVLLGYLSAATRALLARSCRGKGLPARALLPKCMLSRACSRELWRSRAFGGILASSVKPYYEPSTRGITKPFRMLLGILAVAWLLGLVIIYGMLPDPPSVLFYVYIGVEVVFIIDTSIFYMQKLIARLSNNK